jgi:KDO2-lipid IV(A) lauroyltransferase
MDTVKAALITALLRVCALLPLSWARALGRFGARLYWPVGGRSRRVTERNIAAAFPELSAEEQRQLAQQSLRATGELMTETGHVWLRDIAYVRGLVRAVHGAECITAAQAEGRGVIVLAPHLGNWEMVGLHLPSLGATVSLYEPPQIAALGALMESARERSGATLVPTDSRGLARLLRSVKGGHISGILPDQVPPDENSGENVEFFGIPCFTGTLASNMIRRTGALAVFGFARRVRGGFELYYEPAEAAIYDADTAVSLAALNRGVERCVRQCVAQYQWEYKRFKVRPRIKPDFYQVN